MVNEKRGFIFMDDVGREAAKRGMEYAKVVLDTLRNFIVVAFLFYAADKSGKWYVWVVAGVGFFALYFYVNAWLGQLHFYPGITKDPLLRLLLVLLSFAIAAVVSIGILVAMIVAVTEIANVQSSR